MRYFGFIAPGFAVLVVIGALCLKGGQADAGDTTADAPHTFAHYASHALHVGDPVIVRNNSAGGFSINLVPRDQFDDLRSSKICETVKEVHSDYVVFRKKGTSNTFQKDIIETVVPFHAITVITRYTDEGEK